MALMSHFPQVLLFHRGPCLGLCFATKERQWQSSKQGNEGHTSSTRQRYVILFQQFRASGLCVLARSCRTPVLGCLFSLDFPGGSEFPLPWKLFFLSSHLSEGGS